MNIKITVYDKIKNKITVSDKIKIKFVNQTETPYEPFNTQVAALHLLFLTQLVTECSSDVNVISDIKITFAELFFDDSVLKRI